MQSSHHHKEDSDFGRHFILLANPCKECHRRPSERSHRVIIMLYDDDYYDDLLVLPPRSAPDAPHAVKYVEKLKGDKCLPVIVKQLYAMHIRMMKLHLHASSLLFLTHIRHLVIPSELTTDQFFTHITIDRIVIIHM